MTSPPNSPALTLIVALSENRVIGREGDMPWRQSGDLKRFKALTMGHPILMGRKTFESIGRPLPGRRMIVVTRQSTLAGAPEVCHSLPEAIAAAQSVTTEHADQAPFVIGGGEIYRLALPLADRIYLTRIHATIDGDTHFPDLPEGQWRQVSRERHPADSRNQYDYSFEEWTRIAPAADQ
ncbi:dihydrofolate reductase [Lignipirellula cremea]|uniref:Dihydrofolate reductase n=1 Tax=Lignipirellula cremea TaxID=2528010 RepID=A0A518DZD7_9BACT|nr:dihydrofolate reductase [Lignipirellula cremea]QDU97171.1 Dihydrofolate reductase type 3 [Lignipirellula cremea]